MRIRGLFLALLAVVFVALGSRVQLTTDAADILPTHSALRETLEAARDFQGANLIFVELDGAGVDREALEAEVAALAERLRELEAIESVRTGFDGQDGVSIAERIGPHVTAFVSADALAERTSEPGIRAHVALQKQRLAGFGGALRAAGIRDDPLDLREIALRGLRSAQRPGVTIEDGLLLDASRTHALVLASTAIGPRDVEPGDPRIAAIDDAIAHSRLPALWFGGVRIAYETATAVERDSRLTAGMGMALLMGVLFLGFRSWRPVAGAALPALVAAGTATVGAWWASPIHGLQLGFSAALAGLAVDYWVHLYLAAAAKPGQETRADRYRAALEAVRELSPALWVSAASTALAFLTLTTSPLPIVRVLGITGAAAAAGALLGTLLAGPVAWALFGTPSTRKEPPTTPRWATLVVGGALLAGLFGVGSHFEPDPIALVAKPPALEHAERELNARYPFTRRRGIVLLEGATRDEAMERAARALQAFDGLGFAHPSGPTRVLPSPSELAARTAVLPPVDVLQARLDAAAEAEGLPPFAGAAQRIHDRVAPPSPDLWDGTALAEAVTLAGTRALVSVPIHDDTVIPALQDALWRVEPDADFVVPGALAIEGMDETRRQLLERAVLGGLAVFALLTVRHRHPGTAALALVPAAGSICGALGLMALFGEPWNPVSLAAMVPVLGLAVDYGVFMTERATRTAPRAVMLSALTTLAGFVTLGIARSPALYGVGIATFAGVGTAALAALFVLPAALEHGWPGRRVRRVAGAVLAIAAFVAHADLLLNLLGSFPPPDRPAPPEHALEILPGERRFGPARLKRDDGVWLMYTEGSGYETGYAAGTLTADLRPRVEDELFDSFQTQVPNPAFRWLITRGSVVAGLGLDGRLDPEHRLEILGTLDSTPERYWFAGPSYTRGVYYHAIHDLGQALVDSPLLACTGFVAGPGATADGHWRLARNFDFEGGVAFDRDKIVRVHRPDGGIPFLSVAFGGIVGAVSGLNQEGLAVAINAGASDDPPRVGTPMTLIVREILQSASSLDDAERILRERTGFVSENVMVVDADAGEAALFEVSPARVQRVPVDDWLAVSNHFRHPAFADDATNRERMETSTTVQRLARMEERVEDAAGRIDDAVAVDILADRMGVGGAVLPRGHRHALNADIATHSIVLDATERRVWVSRFPNLTAGFVEVRLEDALQGTLHAERVRDPEAHAEAALALREGRQLLRRARRTDLASAERLTAQALSRMPDHPEALYERGRVLHALGHTDRAEPLLRAALATPPEYAYQIEAIEALLSP